MREMLCMINDMTKYYVSNTFQRLAMPFIASLSMAFGLF